MRPKPGTGGGNSEAGGEKQSVEISGGTSNEGQDRGGSLADPTAMLPLERRVEVEGSSDPENRDAEEGARLLAVSGVDGSDGDGGEDESGGGCLDEVKRRCSLLETALKASRREASEARRARDAAERTVSKQRAALVTLRTRISDLEASFAKEQGSGKVRTVAALCWGWVGGFVLSLLTNCFIISRDGGSADHARGPPRVPASQSLHQIAGYNEERATV